MRNKRLKEMGAMLALIPLFAMAGTPTIPPTPHAQAAERSTQMRIGYTDGNQGVNLGTGQTVVVQCAIQFPKNEMQRLQGNKITSLRIAMGKTSDNADNYIFIANDLTLPPAYKQTVGTLTSGWNSIALDSPFEITGSEIFIGFRYQAAGNALSMDGREDNDLANWIQITPADNDTPGAWTHQGGGSINLVATVEGDNLPQNDIQLERVVAKRYASTQGSTPLELLVRNKGAAEVRSMEVEYTIEGQESQTQTINNLAIGSNQVALVKMSDIVFEHSGLANLDVHISKVNGTDDESPANNSGTVENIASNASYTNRKVLLEHFSTARCNNCPEAHKTIDDALTYRSDVIHVVHHAGMGTDALTIPAHEDYLFFYSDGQTAGSIYAPAAMLDRSNMSPYGATDGSSGSTPGPVFFPQRGSLGHLLDQQISTPALVTVNINTAFDESTRTVSVSASGSIPSGNPDRLKADDIRLNIFLVEDSILGQQAGAADPARYYHNNCVRAVLTDTWGDPIDFEEGRYHSGEYTYLIPQEWNPRLMRVVAFLANTDRNNPNNCKVYNANAESLTGNTTSGISPTKPNGGKLRAYAKDGVLLLHGNNTEVSILNVSGQLMANVPAKATSVHIAAWPKGIYMAKAKTTDGTQCVKFIKR